MITFAESETKASLKEVADEVPEEVRLRISVTPQALDNCRHDAEPWLEG